MFHYRVFGCLGALSAGEQFGRRLWAQLHNPSKRIKIGPSSLAFPSVGPACYQDRASDLGLGRDEAGLAAGMKLKEVWEAATKNGIDTSYAQFRVYISRLRRRQRSNIAPLPPQLIGNAASSEHLPQPDPFRNLREQREKKKKAAGFEYDPFSINKNLID